MGFDNEQDKYLGRLFDGIAITITIICVLVLMFMLSACGTNAKKPQDCTFICPDLEDIPNSCYCLHDIANCK